jgi:hypothetical protein
LSPLGKSDAPGYEKYSIISDIMQEGVALHRAASVEGNHICDWDDVMGNISINQKQEFGTANERG